MSYFSPASLNAPLCGIVVHTIIQLKKNLILQKEETILGKSSSNIQQLLEVQFLGLFSSG